MSIYFIISQLSSLWVEGGSSFEQIWIPFTRGYFVPSLVEIRPVVLEMKIVRSCQFIFIISQLSPLWKKRGPLFVKNFDSLFPEILCAMFGWNWPSGTGEEDEKWKVYRQTDGQIDHGLQVIRKAHLSFQLRWASNTFKGIDSQQRCF